MTYDPASGASITWNARNQAANVGGFSEQYDGLGRRETNSAGLSFEHDGSAMIGWSETGASYSFLTLPGGGTLAGSYTANGTTTTWVPIIDASGSTIALVNPASTQSPATTYTYDPSGTPTLNGATNLWPFLYKGLEQESVDAPYYYTGSGQFYSPQMVRSLSGAGETGTSGAGGFSPAGMTIPLPSVSSAGLSPQSLGNDTQQAFQVGTDIYNTSNQLGLSLDNGEFPLALPLAIIGGAVDFLVNFFEDILGGGSTPMIPRQLLKNRHPLYHKVIGVSESLIIDEKSSALLQSQNRPTLSAPTSSPTPAPKGNNTLEVEPEWDGDCCCGEGCYNWFPDNTPDWEKPLITQMLLKNPNLTVWEAEQAVRKGIENGTIKAPGNLPPTPPLSK